jgi:hypothetical protein
MHSVRQQVGQVRPNRKQFCWQVVCPGSSARRVKAHEVNRGPSSLWMIVPWGARASMAMPSALVTSAAVGEESMDQPTTRPETVSSPTAQ